MFITLGFPILLGLVLIFVLVKYMKLSKKLARDEQLFQDVIDDRDLNISTLEYAGEMLSRQVQKRDALIERLQAQLDDTHADLTAALDNLKMILEGPLWTPNISFENYEPEWLSKQTQEETYAEQVRRENYEEFMDESYNPDKKISASDFTSNIIFHNPA